MAIKNFLTHKTLYKYLGIYCLCILVMTLIAILGAYVPKETGNLIFNENGVIESVTVLFYALCLIMMARWYGVESLFNKWYIYILLLALPLRELDFDKKFTTLGILKSKFFFSDLTTMTEKIIAGFVLLTILAAVLFVIKNHTKSFFINVLKLKPAEWAMGFGFGMMIISKTIDGVERKLASFNISISEDSNILVNRCEEIYEIAIPLAFLYAIYLYSDAHLKAHTKKQQAKEKNT